MNVRPPPGEREAGRDTFHTSCIYGACAAKMACLAVGAVRNYASRAGRRIPPFLVVSIDKSDLAQPPYAQVGCALGAVEVFVERSPIMVIVRWFCQG